MQRTALATILFCLVALPACQAPGPTPADAPPRGGAAVDGMSEQATPFDLIAAPPPAMPAPRAALPTGAVQDGGPASGHRARHALEALEARRQVAHAPAPASALHVVASPAAVMAPPANTERYAARTDNPVQRAADVPLSTFSVDVDTGSYSNVRRMLRAGVRPPADAVRAEEFINYFSYGHPAPRTRAVPFRVTTEMAPAPWNPRRHLLMVGIKGFEVPKAALPPANLVFLVNTSGSMRSPDKLPLLQQAFAMLVAQLRPQDRVSIVAYAGSAGLVLPPTPGDDGDRILAALDRLQAGGSTNGGAGIALAYATAHAAHIDGGINRVILASDGDFNVGTVDTGALETLVAAERRRGVALTTLGFGQGNYHDALAERLADVGDGHHAYIDTPQEARKVLVEHMQSTLLTIARDVKVQVEFNPAVVAEYRLVGYENRLLADADFGNDRVDAGDIGAGHEVTALYEVALVGGGGTQLPALRYGTPGAPADAPRARTSDEVAQVQLRYKRPGEYASRLLETAVRRPVAGARAGEALRFAAAVAAHADALRGGARTGGWDWDAIAGAARGASGADPWGLRAEFVTLVDAAAALSQAPPVAVAD